MTKIEKMEREAFRRGVLAAAEIARTYNSTSTHEYDLGDCVAMKLNAVPGEPRKNKKRVMLGDMFALGLGASLAEVHRLGKHSSTVREVARNANFTLVEAKRIGLGADDRAELRRAKIE